MELSEMKRKSLEYRLQLDKLDELINFLSESYDKLNEKYTQMEYDIYIKENENFD
jgi:hypothetical protein